MPLYTVYNDVHFKFKVICYSEYNLVTALNLFKTKLKASTNVLPACHR